VNYERSTESVIGLKCAMIDAKDERRYTIQILFQIKNRKQTKCEEISRNLNNVLILFLRVALKGGGGQQYF